MSSSPASRPAELAGAGAGGGCFSERPDPRLSTVRVLDSGGRVVAGAPPGRSPTGPGAPGAGGRAPGRRLHGDLADRPGGRAPHRRRLRVRGGRGRRAQLPPSQAVAEVRTGPALGPAWPAAGPCWGLTLLVGGGRHRAAGVRRPPARPPCSPGAALAAAAGGLVAMAAAQADAGVSLASVLGSTTGGWLLWRAAMLAAAGRRGLAAGPPRAPGDRCVGAAAGAGMLVHALAGHAAGPSSLRALNLLAQWAHLLAVGVWIGGLAWLLAGLWRHAGAGSTRRRWSASPLAGISLAAVVATGGGRTSTSWRVGAAAGQRVGGRSTQAGAVRRAGGPRGAQPLPAGAAVRRQACGAGPLGRLRRGVGGELRAGRGRAGGGGAAQPAPPGRAGRRGRPPGRAATPVPGGQRPDWGTSCWVTLTVTPGRPGPSEFTATVADFDTGTDPARRPGRAGRDAGVPPDLGTARLELTEAADGRWTSQGRLLTLAGR